MASRVNIEGKLWSDPRFQDLIIKVGNRHQAKGMVVELFTMAQEHWFPQKLLIPRSDFDRAGLGLLVDVGLAEQRTDGIYCKGSEEAFAWLFEKQDAGKKSAETRKKRYGTAQPGKNRKSRKKSSSPNTDRTVFNSARTLPNSSEAPSLTPSPSLPLPPSQPYSVRGEGSAEADPADVKNPVGYFIGTYRKAYQARYGDEAKPDVRGKVQGQIKKLLEDVPLFRACALIQTYCEMNDSWFIENGHDFGTFLAKLSKVSLKLDTGKAPTRQQARDAERAEANLDAFGLNGGPSA